MAGKNTAVFEIYRNSGEAKRAVDRIVAAGFSNNDISVLLPDNRSSKEFAHEKNTKAPEGTTTGVTAGGAVGGTLGLLAGIGALAIPGLGPFIPKTALRPCQTSLLREPQVVAALAVVTHLVNCAAVENLCRPGTCRQR